MIKNNNKTGGVKMSKFRKVAVCKTEEGARNILYNYYGGKGYLSIHKDKNGNSTDSDEVWIEQEK